MQMKRLKKMQLFWVLLFNKLVDESNELEKDMISHSICVCLYVRIRRCDDGREINNNITHIIVSKPCKSITINCCSLRHQSYDRLFGINEKAYAIGPLLNLPMKNKFIG